MYTRKELAFGWSDKKRRCADLESEVADAQPKLDAFNHLERKVAALEKELRKSETSRSLVEGELSNLKSIHEGLSRTNPLAEYAAAMYPLFMGVKNQTTTTHSNDTNSFM